MITKPTVFILGAGASYGFGYPLGKKLVDIIIDNFDPEKSENAITLFKGLGFSEEDIITFREKLRLSAAPSIDTFLEPRGEDDRYLGKLAIANALIPFEKTNKLFEENSWYKTLMDKLKISFDDFDKNKISFITFNYDRSLEHFLMTALLNRFNKTEKEVADKLKMIPVIHLYGKLGLLPWEAAKQDEYTREYSSTILPHLLRRSSKSLKIIYDKLELDNPEFKQAKQVLSAARKIYFLGFGYHSDNLDRLKIKSYRTYSTGLSASETIYKKIEGTSYKLPLDLKDTLYKTYGIKLPNHEWDINDFLDQIKLE